MSDFNLDPFSEKITMLEQNRAFLYGDGVFETVKIVDSRILYFEDHYFRLMSSMRVIRMEIPMNFTMEYLEEAILSQAAASDSDCLVSGRARITVYRNPGGYYLPDDNTVSFRITATPQSNKLYESTEGVYEVDLYKDFHITRQLLSSIKSTNKLINITGSIFASENGLQNCLLLNDSKSVVEALNGNIFMLFGNKLLTPPVSEGCVNGIMRKQILAIAEKTDYLEVVEEVFSPFDLQKADELFITNVIMGIQPVTRYRKKDYESKVALDLLKRLNAQLLLI